MKDQKPAIAVHGGAGEWHPERQRQGIKGVEKAVNAGYELLTHDGTAIDAVEAAVMTMEDDEVFNAGLGSSLSLDRTIQMEASIMDGRNLSAGATALLTEIKNPIRLARVIMERTDHIFIVGRGAEELAKIYNLEHRNPITKLRERYWQELRTKIEKEELDYLPKLCKLLKTYPDLFKLDTVGAAATDKEGNVAAATSTGGLSFKIPGRIGDSPLIGCGNYADNKSGACSATGIGEIAIRLVLAKNACDLIRSGQTPQDAAENSIKEVNHRIQSTTNQMGLIAIDTNGRIGAAQNSRHMCWAYMTRKISNPKTYLEAKIVE